MPDQGRRVVLWCANPLTLGDELLACGVEHCARECGIGDAEFNISFDHLVHSQPWKQPSCSWQGCVEQLLQDLVERYFPFYCPGLQLSALIGLDLYEPSQVSLADDILCHEPTDLARAHTLQQAKKKGAREHPVLGF